MNKLDFLEEFVPQTLEHIKEKDCKTIQLENIIQTINKFSQ